VTYPGDARAGPAGARPAGRAPAASAAGCGLAGPLTLRLPSPFYAPGLTVSGFGLPTVPAWNHSQINKRSTLGLFIGFHGAACGQFRLLLYPQGAGRVLPVKGPFMSAAGWRDPQHFHRRCTGTPPFCTSNPHACAHLASQQSVYRAGSQQQITAPGPRDTPTRRTRGPADADEIAQQGTDGRHRLQHRRAGYPPPACRSCSS